MSSSDRKINYNLRPSKSIERKMILEVLKEVCTPNKSKEFRYVGFGASFFADFKIIHKTLSIDDLISIEGEVNNRKRIEFNKPFKCIEIKIGNSTDVLPQLTWEKKNIVWLDYESSLQLNMFTDIEHCARNLVSESFLIITLRNEIEQRTFKDFEDVFKNNFYSGLKEEDIQPRYFDITIRKMLLTNIIDNLEQRNAAYQSADKSKVINFHPLFNFTYQDGAKMMTFGGIYLNEEDENKYKNSNYNNLPFITKNEDPFNISFPIITNKEYHLLNKLLPSDKNAFLRHSDLEFIPDKHKESFHNTYKYYPAFIEISDM